MENFFGGEIVLTNDTCWFGFPENEEDEETVLYYIPSPLPRSYMKEPDYEKYLELRNIDEL
ncbi:MAG: hypothetical protein NZ927_07055 [Candidatus Calescibacterium sp.]|nr:hypothetical protein [Candidatus Calescibacterium sp.]MCX7733596.1 hypothetical protein [bacterium]